MRRGYTRSEYLDRIDRLRQRCPEVALSTDIIVGFPGETDGDFERTLELLGQVEYDEIYSFMYSPRTQTVSAKLYNDDVPQEKKKERLKQVQDVQREISLKKKQGKDRADRGSID
jgi:tRNA-2-methylthio-N6-dimethylallyladenosine synthase